LNWSAKTPGPLRAALWKRAGRFADDCGKAGLSMKYLIVLALALALAGPAWAGPQAPEPDACRTDRHWRQHCPAVASKARAARSAISPAKARAKERTLDTYKAMEQAKARAKAGSGPEGTEARKPGAD
jgi:hypothetical protein